MNTEDFQFFIRVADLGSISRAAQEANISVSVASQRIQRLEQNLQLRLLHRTTRKLSLTEEGKTMLEHGRLWLHEFSSLQASLKVQDKCLSGTLRITTSATFGTKILMAVITEFSLLHPELKIHLDLNDQNIDLIQYGMDLAIRIGKLKSSTLIAKALTSNPRLLCASPAYLEKYGRPQTLSDLKLHRCILQQHEHGLTDHWNFITKMGELQQIQVAGYFTTNSGEGVRQASLSGLGISNHSIWHVSDDLKAEKLVQVLAQYPVEPTSIYAVFPNRNLIPPKVQLFLEYLLDYFQNHYPSYKHNLL
ncbi:LysR family transcriptional regulator [Acinetobacter sp. 2JN-4]|uniref:LysR family transcriptional regulator n=1 Tax=Acinetobacter sp. 2JN-4 TaxID=2479844 RepID=UPI000EF9B1E2|nr:LysR family transcriptional regulator [Acinetobacter sp. 2JN-4]RLZ07190.1 LysR family transcriptional regulator [Acinetobacter sp. 2JN-4]